RRPGVAAHGDHGRAAETVPSHGGKRAPEGAREIGSELPADETADVVLAEDRLGNVHTICDAATGVTLSGAKGACPESWLLRFAEDDSSFPPHSLPRDRQARLGERHAAPPGEIQQ